MRKLSSLYFATNFKNVVDASDVFLSSFCLFGFGMSKKDEWFIRLEEIKSTLWPAVHLLPLNETPDDEIVTDGYFRRKIIIQNGSYFWNIRCSVFW